jgi:hypothetical protein
MEWSRPFHMTLSDPYEFMQWADVISLADGYLVIREDNGSIAMLRTGLTGDSLWQRGCSVCDSNMHPVAVTAPHGGFAFAALSHNGNPPHGYMHLLRMDSTGALLWDRFYRDVTVGNPHVLLRTLDDGYLLAGYGLGADSGYAFAVRTGPESHEGMNPAFILHPSSFILSSNPNPFNGSTTLTFSVPQTTSLSMRVFDILGRQVGTITEGKFTAGQHSVSWNCETCSSGQYIIRLSSPETSLSRKITLLK